MRTVVSHDEFVLEALEPRLLLSAGPGGVVLVDVAEPSWDAVWIAVESEDIRACQPLESSSDCLAANTRDPFLGRTLDELTEEPCDLAPATAVADESAPEADIAERGGDANSTVLPSPSAAAGICVSLCSEDGAVPPPGDIDGPTAELVDTLHAANPPPAPSAVPAVTARSADGEPWNDPGDPSGTDTATVTLALRAPSGTWQWASSAGGTGYDRAQALAVFPDGGVAVTGSFQSDQIDFGDWTLTGNSSVFFVRYDSAGDILWAVSGGGDDLDYGNDMAVLSDGSLAVVGTYVPPATFFGTTFSDDRMFVAKLMSDGGAAWVISAKASAKAVAATPDGGMLVVGEFFNSVTFGDTTLTGNGMEDAFVVKYDADGNVLWAMGAGGSSSDGWNDIATTADGGFVVTGNAAGTSLAKYDADGTLLWSGAVGGRAVSVADDGSIFVTGAFSGTLDIGGGTVLESAGRTDVITVKYSSDGALLWAVRAGGSRYDRAYGVLAREAGGVVIAGGCSRISEFGTASGSYGMDVFVAGYSANGALEWSTVVPGGESDDVAFALAGAADGSLLIAGGMSGSSSFGDTTLTSGGSIDAFVARLSPPASNAAPTDIGLSKAAVPENGPAGTAVGTLSTTDPDVGDTFAYTLVAGDGDADNASFSIEGDALLTMASFDYEAKNEYSIRVRTDDGNGGSFEEIFLVTVTDVNEPVIDVEALRSDILTAWGQILDALPAWTDLGGLPDLLAPLAGLFSFDGVLEQIRVPEIGAVESIADLVAALESAHFEVCAISGGFADAEHSIPDTGDAGERIRLRFRGLTFSDPDLPNAFSLDPVGLEVPLGDMGFDRLDRTGLSGLLQADLFPEVQLGFGLDEGGAYLLPDLSIGGALDCFPSASVDLAPFMATFDGRLSAVPTVHFSESVTGLLRLQDLDVAADKLNASLGELENRLSFSLSLQWLDYLDVDGNPNNNTEHGGDPFRFAGRVALGSVSTDAAGNVTFDWSGIDIRNPDVNENGSHDFTSEVLVENLRMHALDAVRGDRTELRDILFGALNLEKMPFTDRGLADALQAVQAAAATVIERTEVLHVVDFDTVEQWLNQGLPDSTEEIIRLNLPLVDLQFELLHGLEFDLTSFLPATEDSRALVTVLDPHMAGNLVVGVDTSSNPVYILTDADDLRPDAVTGLGVGVTVAVNMDGQPLGPDILQLGDGRATLDVQGGFSLAADADGKYRIGSPVAGLGTIDFELAEGSGLSVYAESANLFPREDSPLRADATLISGHLDFRSGAFEVEAVRVGLDVAEAISTVANNVVIGYDPEAGDQEVASLRSALLRIPAVPDLPDMEIAEFAISYSAAEDSFTIDIQDFQFPADGDAGAQRSALVSAAVEAGQTRTGGGITAAFGTGEYRYEMVGSTSLNNPLSLNDIQSGVSINDHGTVLFAGVHTGGTDTLYRWEDGVIDSSIWYEGWQIADAVRINNAGHMVVQLRDGARTKIERIVGADRTTVDSSGDAGWNLHPYPALNNAGNVVYSGTDSADGTAVHRMLFSEIGIDDKTELLFGGFLPILSDNPNRGILIWQQEGIRFYKRADSGDILEPIQTQPPISMQDYRALGRHPGVTDDATVVVFSGIRKDRPGVRQGLHLATLSNGEWTTTELLQAGGRHAGDIVGFDPESCLNIASHALGDGRQALTISFVASTGNGKALYTMSGIFHPASGTLDVRSKPEEIARSGESLPGMTGTVTDLRTYDAVNAKGQVAFWLEALGADGEAYEAVLRADPVRRPILLIPRAGVSTVPPGSAETFISQSGLSPSSLAFHAGVADNYTPLLGTLTSLGYELGEDLLVVHYDWRLPMTRSRPSDSTSGDALYAAQVDYLIAALASLTQIGTAQRVDEVTVIADGEGALLARAYQQLAADLQGSRPQIRELVCIDAPHQGKPDTFNALNDVWGEKAAGIGDAAFSLIKQTLKAAYQEVLAGGTVQGPGGADIALSDISPQGWPDIHGFIRRYAPGLQDVIPQQPFIVDAFGKLTWLRLATPAYGGYAASLTPTFTWETVRDVDIASYNLYVSVADVNAGLLPTMTPDPLTPMVGADDSIDMNPTRILTVAGLPGDTASYTLGTERTLTRGQT